MFVEKVVAPPRATGQGPTPPKLKVLFLSANPSGTASLDLSEEAREIQEKISKSAHRDSIEFITALAARPDDLLQALNQHRPHVVHFSGHGNSTEELKFLDKHGEPKLVSKRALVQLFRTLKRNIRLVVLNACSTLGQAEAITGPGPIECAIGMTRDIGDHAAIVFASSFYRAIGFGESIEQAYEQGKAALLLEGIEEADTPVLLCKKGVTPAKIMLIDPEDRKLL
ncbi:CHAT domain-containing protein [Bradyrhizobium sp. INPA01-394B]|uniref:CHAT domain-containing protein n=1 Tax=Bradyrhizobium campsiandrae TaxID=1729892 RepID=A0ABR7UHE7_9BRAD|nr:CHAT domain-containing protein [Bradyrhizobium campsiandrae]MBC9878666.1 CHAT domain-containing protein [Bradyrhizobium campsiandrae]MBC9983313.1 CHAT domain-containing protein [Bradyrhizobium campsiandrae]